MVCNNNFMHYCIEIDPNLEQQSSPKRERYNVQSGVDLYNTESISMYQNNARTSDIHRDVNVQSDIKVISYMQFDRSYSVPSSDNCRMKDTKINSLTQKRQNNQKLCGSVQC
ncbi:hypothetical protein ACJMK2_013902 [Sinanodonta woodiana]|uniref:Uncharacterized protein n=1 Tax=Sinanodonta woodiana TaxID=1069815 RepID=A0ABD3V0X5_SINWO